ncbi:MAG: GNAT family N-acetyltransferase [Actinomycetota bacterium]|nr:GNAT family N-acetyltransferase [Actinomycetota bacterium]
MSDAVPTLQGARLVLRPGAAADVAALGLIREEASVTQWWGRPEPAEQLAAALRGDDDEVVLVIEIDGRAAGLIQFLEENEPDYRHASIDIYLGSRYQDAGLGREAIALLAAYLIDVRGHHRLTIDPAVANERAIRSYRAVGFRPVGVMRRYERGLDGEWHDGLMLDLLAEELVRPA